MATGLLLSLKHTLFVTDNAHIQKYPLLPVPEEIATRTNENSPWEIYIKSIHTFKYALLADPGCKTYISFLSMVIHFAVRSLPS